MARGEHWRPSRDDIFRAMEPYLEGFQMHAAHEVNMPLFHFHTSVNTRLSDITKAMAEEALFPQDRAVFEHRLPWLFKTVVHSYHYTSRKHNLQLPDSDVASMPQTDEALRVILGNPEYRRTFCENIWRLPSVSNPLRYLLLPYVAPARMYHLDDGAASGTGQAIWNTEEGKAHMKALERQFPVLKRKRKRLVVGIANDIQHQDDNWTLACSTLLHKENNLIQAALAERHQQFFRRTPWSPLYDRWTGDLFEDRKGWHGKFNLVSNFYMMHQRHDKTFEDWMNLANTFLIEGGRWAYIGAETQRILPSSEVFDLRVMEKQNGEMVDLGVAATYGEDQSELLWLNEDFPWEGRRLFH